MVVVATEGGAPLSDAAAAHAAIKEVPYGPKPVPVLGERVDGPVVLAMQAAAAAAG